MTSFKTTYLCNKILDYIFGKTTYTPPTTLYFALYTANPTKAGNDGTEVVIGRNAYARASCTNNTTNWNDADSATKTNKTDIVFATPTSAYDGNGWGTITAVAIFDAATGGNMLEAVILTSSKTVGTGVVVKFKAGNLTVTEA